MITRNAIRLENTDMADPKKLREALNLVGGEHSRDPLPKAHGREQVHPDLKPFNYIFSNDFTMMDVIKAVAFIYSRKIELYESAADIEKDMPVGGNATVMADGIRASADLACRIADDFLANLNEDRQRHRELADA